MSTLDSPSPPPTSSNAGRARLMGMIGALFAAAAIGYGLYWSLVARYRVDTEDAYVQGNVVQVTPQVQGTVSRILADDTDIVQPGQPLLEFDHADAEVSVDQAEAQLGQAVREVKTLFSNQAQAEANLALRQAELARAQDDYLRRRTLQSSGAVSGEELRHAELAAGVAQAAVAAAKEQLAAGRALVAGTGVERHPKVLAAASRLQDAMLAQSRTTLYAPAGGQVAKRNVQVGQRVAPGTPLMAIVPLDQLWVDANFKEGQLRNMRVGQQATLVTDLYGSGVAFHGRVIGLGAGTGAAFALLPAQNATGNWIKVVQRVPVRIALDPKELAAHPLRIGLSVTATVDLHDQGGATLGSAGEAKATMASALSGKGADQLEAAIKARIAAVIAANLR